MIFYLYISLILKDKDNQCMLIKKNKKIYISNVKFLNSESLILGTNHRQIILINIINKKLTKLFLMIKKQK